MKYTHAIALAVMTAALAGGAALAHGQKGHGKQMRAAQAGAMHSPGEMMGGSMMGGGMMGGAHMGPGGAFHESLDADEDGRVTPDEARAQLGSWLEESDTDGDGTLNIQEFEVLHSRMIRELMVDRFQHLDADGDGQVTRDEMTAPARQMERMQKMREMRMQRKGDMRGMGMDMDDDDMPENE